jgi:HlyD family secretion protein
MKRAIITLVTLVVLIGGGVFIAKRLNVSGGKTQNQYRIALVGRDMVKKTVTATGTLKPWTTVDIKSRAGGRVIKLAVDEGNIVKKGAVIAEIDPSDTLLTYNSAKADIESNTAKIDQTTKQYSLQQQQTIVALQTADANVASAKAGEAAAKARYEQAKSTAGAAKDLSEAAVESASANLAAEQAKLVQMTSAGHPQRAASVNAAYNQALANVKNAEHNLKRQQALLKQGFVAQSVVDDAQANYDVMKASLDNTQQVTTTLKPELDTDLKTEQARVAQMQAALRTAEANRVDIKLKRQAADSAWADYQQAHAGVLQAEAARRRTIAERMNDSISHTQITQAKAAIARSNASLDNAKVQLNDTPVTAPSDGVILNKYIEEGTLISSGISFNSTGTSIVQMGDISRQYVDVQVDETDVANVDIDQKVDITFDAYPSTPFEGKVIKIDPQAVVDSNVTTIHVRVEVDNSDAKFQLLKPGMDATCEFIINKKDDVIAVPNEALKTADDGSKYVEIADGGKPAPIDKGGEPDPNLLVEVKPVKRPIKVDLEGNDNTEVTEGLKEGDRIITQTIEPSTTPAGGNPFGGSKGPGRK